MPSRTAHHITLAIPVLAFCLFACSDERSSPTQASTQPPTHCPSQTTRAAHQDICILDSCGNGIVDTTEVCDDGNRIDGDGCSSDCRSTEVCGNGILDFTVGELCDDGNAAAHATCCADCRSCPELAVALPPAGTNHPSESRFDAPPALDCNPAELQRALVELDAASARADHAMGQASQAIQQARAASRRANQTTTDEHHAGPQARIRDLEQRNADLQARLAAAEQRLQHIATGPPNGRTTQLD